MAHNKGKRIIQVIARKNGKSEEEVYRDMQETIDVAWASDNLESQRLQRSLFPDGKPTPEEFIETISEYIKQQT